MKVNFVIFLNTIIIVFKKKKILKFLHFVQLDSQKLHKDALIKKLLLSPLWWFWPLVFYWIILFVSFVSEL
jgi:hypothetical protein